MGGDITNPEGSIKPIQHLKARHTGKVFEPQQSSDQTGVRPLSASATSDSGITRGPKTGKLLDKRR